jgi:hypothetical protein
LSNIINAEPEEGGEFVLTADVTEIMFDDNAPFDPLLPSDGMWLPEIVDEGVMVADSFEFPVIEIAAPDETLPQWVTSQWGTDVPEWVDAYLDGRKIAITPENDQWAALSEMFEDSDAGKNLNGITVADVFEWVGW